MTFAFSTFPYPHFHRLVLRLAFLIWGEVRAYHVSFTCHWMG